jgi:hypothetical protein
MSKGEIKQLLKERAKRIELPYDEYENWLVNPVLSKLSSRSTKEKSQ